MTAPSTHPKALDTPALVCPECRARGSRGKARIGSGRSRCGTCNRFISKARMRVLRELTNRHPEEAEQVWLLVEAQVYRELIDQLNAEAGTPDGVLRINALGLHLPATDAELMRQIVEMNQLDKIEDWPEPEVGYG